MNGIGRQIDQAILFRGGALCYLSALFAGA